MESNKAINYYGTDKINQERLLHLIEAAVASIKTLDINEAIETTNFAKAVFELSDVADLLIQLSRLPVFETEHALSLQHDLDLLALTKKLKFFTNLPICQVLLLLQQLVERDGVTVPGYEVTLLRLIQDNKQVANMKMKDFVKQFRGSMNNAGLYFGNMFYLLHNTICYLSCLGLYDDNSVALETIDPHAVYPTSIYRHSNGLTLATPDSQTIEAVMTTSLTTTIKITRGVLDPANTILANVYKPLGRCVAVVDDKVIVHYGAKLEAYFAAHGISLVTLIHGGNEVDKDIHHVEEILVELKKNNVARHEPVLIMGGGVIADIGGFATALYHRSVAAFT